MTFRVGQKVVCISSFDRTRRLHNIAVPIKGSVYTVTGTTHGKIHLGLTLAEFGDHINPLGWQAAAFRPVAERKTDISIFTRMLNPSKVEANA